MCKVPSANERSLLIDFSFPSIEESVKEDMKVIKKDPYLPKDIEVVGYVYDVFTGKTKEVE